jgi:glyoxylase-like metal-dependent hydrolase (beta-lactamase superfamily II)
MQSQIPKPLRHRASRRQLLQGAIGGMAGMALGSGVLRIPRAFAQTPAVTTTELASGLQVLSVGGSNVVAQTGPDGALLVDGGSAATADAIAAAVADLTRGPIHTLFNTHWHPEQTGLNTRLGPAGARIIAQENTRLWLTTDITYPWDGSHFEPLPEAGRPTESFYDAGELESGVQYGYLRHAAHTDGDLYVKFPAENVLAVGDTITGAGAGWPFVDWWTGGWIGGIVGNLELLLTLADDATRVVPATGPVLDRAELQTQYDMYNTVYERLATLLNRGRGPDEAVAAKPTAEFDAKMGPPDAFVKQAFESLWAYLSPDARNVRPGKHERAWV